MNNVKFLIQLSHMIVVVCYKLHLAVASNVVCLPHAAGQLYVCCQQHELQQQRGQPLGPRQLVLLNQQQDQ